MCICASLGLSSSFTSEGGVLVAETIACHCDIMFGVSAGAPKHSPQDDHFVPHDGHLVNLNFGIHAVL